MNTSTAIKHSFEGVWVETLTPLNEHDRIDLHKLQAHIRTLLSKGAKGFLLFGYLGEGASFSSEEKAETISYLIKSGIEPSNLMLTISNNAMSDAAKLIHFAQSAHLHGVTLCAPSFYKPLQRMGLSAYFNQLIQMLEQSELKLYLHLLSAESHVDVPESVLSEVIHQHEKRIFGILNDTGLGSTTQDLLKSFATQMKIHSHNEFDLVALNSTGTVSRMANLMPRVIDKLLHQEQTHQEAFIPGMKIKSPNDRITEFQEVISKMPSVSAYKFLMSQIYHDASWLQSRPPLYRLDQDLMNLISKKFKNFNLQTSEE